jgi:diacylglycerol kinase (ATP)
VDDSIFVVFNPHAGKGRGAQFVTPVLEELGSASRVEHALTQAPGDEARLASEAVVPGGTGCDLAKSLGVPSRDVHACCRIVRDGFTRTIDVGRIEDRYFLNVAGFGYDVAVLEDSWNVAYLEGSLLYLYCALRQLGSYRGFRLAGEADGRAFGPQDMLMVIVANARVFGGGFRVAPAADLEDGRLDVWTFGNMGFGGRVSALVRLLLGRHASHPRVGHVQAARLVYRFAAPPSYETDGEWNQARGLELIVESVPKALRVLVPRP